MSGAAVDLYWIPLGAGGRVVRASGVLFEAASALLQHRPRCSLYHSALEVRLPEGRYAIEQPPVPDLDGTARGVIASGAVGARWLGGLRLFRYEIRCWRDGTIPDIAEAVDCPVRVSDDVEIARRIVAELPHIPSPVWGRDELAAGEMWNSNSVVSWALARGGVDVASIALPVDGRAPGWDAGRIVAARESARESARRHS
ncbi:MAG: hypothetical protein HZB15_04565 [Actinobacteria bacterium]|nr:hypothetical protein [Actinomycetota bacterium]